MRAATVVEILARAERGRPPEEIARNLHISLGRVKKVLGPAGYPDLGKVKAYRLEFCSGNHRNVWAGADTLASLAHAVRVDPGFVHAATEQLSVQRLRELVAIAAAMLPADVEPKESLAWLDVDQVTDRTGPECSVTRVN